LLAVFSDLTTEETAMKVRTLIAAVLTASASAAWAADGLFVDSNTVKQVQRTLSDRGYRVGTADGRMGPQTQSALRRFQRAERLEATGQLNHRTLVALGIQKGDAVADEQELHYHPSMVRRVQQTLNNRGFHAGPANGRMTEATHAAIKQFQKSENLEETGRLNDRTLAALGVPENLASTGSSR
jgi:peptidoglycan hydrolase-like protein with peptidoglycan-binding domain